MEPLQKNVQVEDAIEAVMPEPVIPTSSGESFTEPHATGVMPFDRSAISNDDNIDDKYSVNGRYSFPISAESLVKDKVKHTSARTQTLPEVGLLEGSASDTDGSSDQGKLQADSSSVRY